MSNTFWLNDPTVLLDKNHITELWPTNNLNLELKLNAITRLIILLGLLGYLITQSIKIPISAFITLIIIVIIYKTKGSRRKIKEGLTNTQYYSTIKENFYPPKKENPFMNVLLPEIKDNPKRKPAAPSFNPIVERDINNAAGNDPHRKNLVI